jgi:23S rRNA C2498 (ribose-2'-O)-methylase RlmM
VVCSFTARSVRLDFVLYRRNSCETSVAFDVQEVLTLHALALEQASELLVDLDDAAGEESLRSFTASFAERARAVLRTLGRVDEAESLRAEEEEAGVF